ncbi:putative glutathione-specific gamma-glutamylcyclotransferase 2 [Acyrthosiphon pisum]|uniref:glutathione-specific gamma-glutamylcyclotransferase n=1 Tax=Acyrthosiphon pisum TaxID=7029 RepID=A0A8R1W3N6_ACYPI|nr:putative glutathione-specific gamma-glutamylcyclotransferase 2 [Acyrthosiphon pisum]|eukprot:XP_001945247.1 PREDICTED: putative glutathione-specific gamma-glutamylcyclotransferase 2 [Acyrthosiphon pisum]
MAADPEYWVFGYGSLCWNPGFEFKDSMVGYVQGFSRKFWQGNIAHRGTKEKPGRVATLVEDPQGFVWGKAFLLPDETAFRYLEMREVYLGGYQVHKVDVMSDGADECCRRTVNATVYVATPDNGQWLGEAPVDELATQVATCAGPAGHNAEYVILLARWERQHAPVHRVDVELSKLELLVLERLQSIGVRPDDVLTTNNMPSFSSMVPEKKLRCLNI